MNGLKVPERSFPLRRAMQGGDRTASNNLVGQNFQAANCTQQADSPPSTSTDDTLYRPVRRFPHPHPPHFPSLGGGECVSPKSGGSR